jgi:hypothetical protein
MGQSLTMSASRDHEEVCIWERASVKEGQGCDAGPARHCDKLAKANARRPLTAAVKRTGPTRAGRRGCSSVKTLVDRVKSELRSNEEPEWKRHSVRSEPSGHSCCLITYRNRLNHCLSVRSD